MAQSEVHEFLALLTRSQLLTNAQVLAVESSIVKSGIARNIEQVCTELIRRELLTKWQSDQLSRGQTGFVLQQYRLLNPVGRGGMGHVFRARDDRNGAIVAIKVMARRLTGDQTLVNRFRREIRATSLLNNPHIVRTLDAGRVGNVDFMVMEFVSGDQLDKVISRIRILPVGVACEMIRQAAIGLQHAHEKQMVHRDLKPANLMIDWSPGGDGTLKLMDMGLVRLGADDDEQRTVTRTGQIMGTPDYMSPEQGWDTASVDIRSDIYSLGCTLFRLLSGRIPFVGDNPLQLLMARCSKDAPPVRSVRGDIPDSVDQVVQRMTKRDPAERFQTPGEVAAALAPFCQPLTRDAMKKAALSAAAEEDDVIELTAVESEVEITEDAGYQQFLREMRRGAEVDLMTSESDDAAISPFVLDEHAAVSSTSVELPRVTIPTTDVPSITIAQTSTTPIPRSRKLRNQRGRKAGWVAAGVSVIGVAGLSLLLVPNWLGDAGSSGNTPFNSGNTDPVAGRPVVLAEATLEVEANHTVEAGEVLTFQPRLIVTTPPVSGKLVFQLSEGAPAAAGIDAETGVVTWKVPKLQTPEVYPLPLRLLHIDGESRRIVATAAVSVTVRLGAAMTTLPTLPPQRLRTGMPATVSLAATTAVSPEWAATYRMGSGQLPGMQLDPKTGLFTWTPDVDAVGRHEFSVELFSAARDEVLTSATYRVVVLPGTVDVRLPDFPAQKATAGQQLELPLGDSPITSMPRAVRVQLATGSPEGMTLDSRAAVLRWDVPLSASGRVEVRLVAVPALPELEFSPDSKAETTIVIQVAPANSVPQIPPADAIKVADVELRELFRRELANARTAPARVELARLLFEKALDQSAGPTDYALLDLAADQAGKSRASDVLFAVNRLRAARYFTDEIEGGLAIAAEVRRTSLSTVQQDLTVEHSVRLAALAATSGRWSDVAALLVPADTLLRNSSGFAKQLADDVTQVRQLADAVAKSAGESPAPGTGETSDVKAGEIVRLLNRWQFTDLFQDTSSLSFLQASNIGQQFGDNGQSLWKFDADRIQLQTESQAGLIGFLETSVESGRYLIRMSVGTSTNSLQFVFGGGRERDLTAHLLTLDPTGPGRIHRLPGGTMIQDAPAVTSGVFDRSRLVEILVTGTQVSARIDGTPVTTTAIAELVPGRIGLIAPLTRPAPGPRLDVRNMRILMLPE